MKDLDGDFAQGVNARHGRVGHLFQGRFGGVLVERESHLLELLRYVVLNPVRAGMVDEPGAWRWSSYRATAGLAPRPPWLEVDWTLMQFHRSNRDEGRIGYRDFVAAGVGQPRSIWEDLRCGFYLGTAEFGTRLQRLVGERGSDAEYPLRYRRPDRPEADEIERAVCDVFGIRSAVLRRGRGGEARTAFATIARDSGGLRLRAIGEILGVCDARVSRLARAGRELKQSGWGASPADRVEQRIAEVRRATVTGSKVKGKT